MHKHALQLPWTGSNIGAAALATKAAQSGFAEGLPVVIMELEALLIAAGTGRSAA